PKHQGVAKQGTVSPPYSRCPARGAWCFPAGRPRPGGPPPPAPPADPARDAGPAAEAVPAEPDQPRRRDTGRRWLVLAGVTVVYAAIAVAAYLPTLPLDGSHTQIWTCGDTAQEVWF